MTRRVPVPGAPVALAVDDHAAAGRERGQALFLPGFGSVRTGDKAARLAQELPQIGWRFIAFDFEGHGDSGGEFASLTLTRHLRDLGAVRSALLLPAQRPVLIGSSMGGLVAALAAATDPHSIAGLVLIAPAFGFRARFEQRLGARGLAEWQRTGQLAYRSEFLERTIGFDLLVDARRIDEDAVIDAIRCPTLLIHGTADDTVPIAEADRFAGRCRAPLHYLRIEGGSHRLDQHIDPLADAVRRFLVGEALS